MAEQRKKLMSAITLVVTGLRDLNKIVPAVQHLGRKHAGYGVQDSQYDTVGAALIWALAQGLGEAFTPEVEAAWVEAYTILAVTMKAAAAELALEATPEPAGSRLAAQPLAA
jgi:hemoglobin-like flavoprotein